MLGIGMQRHQNDPDGIAWRQNRDFESLLQRLNEGTEAIGPFYKARESSPSGEGQEVVAAEVVDSAHDADATKRETKKKKDKKRRVLQDAEEEEEEDAARDKRERKKRKKSKSDVPGDDASNAREAHAAPTSESTPVPVAAPAPIRALYVVHLHVRLSARAHGVCVLFPSTVRITARAPTAPASSQPSAWLRPTRPRSPKSSASRPPRLPPPPPPPPLHLRSPPQRLRFRLSVLRPTFAKKTRCRN